MKVSEQICKVIPWKAGLDIYIWRCPFCGFQAWEYASNSDNEIKCSLCGRLIWPGSDKIQMEV